MEIGEKHEIEITDLSTAGKGIGRVDGIVTFVPDLVPGDRAEIEITGRKKHIAEGGLVDLHEPSAHRTEARCRHFGKCGGCAMQSLDYAYQVRLKEDQLRGQLGRLYGGELPEFDEPLFMEDPWRYRNKTEYAVSAGPVAFEKKGSGSRSYNTGKLRVGFYSRGSGRVTDARECPIQTEAAELAAYGLRRYIRESGATVYDPKSRRGLVRRLTVRVGFSSGEVMLILTVNGKHIKNPQLFTDIMAEDIASTGEYELVSVIAEYNTHRNTAAAGKFETIAGSGVIHDRVAGMDLEISPQSFYQVNPRMMEDFYGTVKEYAGLTGSETVYDLYCGAGTIGLYLADEADYVWGIESVESAVLDANRNAVLNGAVNIQFVRGKAEEKIDELLEKTGAPDVVILDPPRAGCRPELLESVLRAAPDRIVYASCDPATMARDLKTLAPPGGPCKLTRVRLVDQFCHTMEKECVAQISRTK